MDLERFERMLIDEDAEPTELPLSLLRTITNNFSDDLNIGRGAFADVYKGRLRNGTVAVKKLYHTIKITETKFHQDVDRLMKVKHKNIVRFLGYSFDTQGKVWKLGGKNVMAEERQRFLCFEFLPGGSLDKYTSDASKGLEWMTRYHIIKGICEGLHYLHQQKIVHLELTPANIMLDQYMRPKITNFGLAKFYDQTQTWAAIGQQGYLAQECYDGQKQNTFTSDIYSLGIIIIEMLTGHKGYPEIQNVLESWSSRLRASLEDTRLKAVRLCAEIGILCADFNPAKRPDTWRILERLAEIEPNAAQRSHFLFAPAVHGSSRNVEFNDLELILDGKKEPRDIKLSLLQHITGSFSLENRIGYGGCGEVFKGILRNGIVAVKRLFKNHTMDPKMFDQEVKSMMIVKHQNIVKFLGYCSDTQGKAIQMEDNIIIAEERERLLCFEYIDNGSLANHLTDESRGLDWCTRYRIIKGICDGLYHLHKEKGILHMDLKPDNILINNKMVPKITDFGLSRLDGVSQTRGTLLVSIGYCAPEYLFHGKRSNKSDIYSLGIIIIEMVTGNKADPNITKVLERWKHRWNKSSSEQTPLWYQQVTKCIELARRCTRINPIHRPCIWDIIRELNETDQRAGKVENVTEYTFEEPNPCFTNMLRIQPLEVRFPFVLDQDMSCSIELTNETDDYIAFMVSTTTSLLPYNTQPNRDIIVPRSKCCVSMTLEAQDEERLRNLSEEEFYVLSTRVDENLTTKDITDDMFDEEEDGKIVDEVNLTVVFDGLSPVL